MATQIDNPQSLKEDFEEFKENMDDVNEAFKEALKKAVEANKEQFKDFHKMMNNIKEQNAIHRKMYDELFGTSDETRYLQKKLMQKNLEKIKSSDYTEEDKKIFAQMTEEDFKNIARTTGMISKVSDKTIDEISESLTQLTLGYKNFSTVVQDLNRKLLETMVGEISDATVKAVFNKDNLLLLGAGAKAAGVWGKGALGSVGGLLGGIFKRHSGGFVPEGASLNIPGTEEQLALLKGGERILSPGENVEYLNGQASAPVVFVNYNIKAWDSKDVKKYLVENKDLLNNITYQGIKNNNSQLRSIIRNA